MKYVITLSLLAVASIVFAQISADDLEYHTDFVPPSANASSLGKYGDIPVSLYTGVPQIDIPIYTLASDELSLPVSLSYHASGNKVEEVASWVGLGWTLNAGGVITRTVKGLPDDQYETEFKPDPIGLNKETNAGYLYGGTQVVNEYANPSKRLLEEIKRGLHDGEPDVFFYNFLGYSGKFAFDHTGTIHVFNQNNLKIEYFKTAQGPITSFEITTPDAIRFVFDKIEETHVYSGYYKRHLVLAFKEGRTKNFDLRFSEKPFTSSWYLTGVYSERTGKQLFDISYIDNGYTDYQVTNENSRDKVYNSFLAQSAKTVSEITSDYGSIKFLANHQRQDLGGITHALTNIEIYNRGNSKIKDFELVLDYFTAPTCTSALDPSFMCKRLKLEEVIEKDAFGNALPPHAFTYNSTDLPPRYSAEQDFWGYYNGNGALTMLPELYFYPADTVTTAFPSNFSIFPRAYYTGPEHFVTSYNLDYVADRNPDPILMHAHILEKITYPTGGYTEFTYEPHEFIYDHQTFAGGGLRIKSITDADGLSSSPDIIKTYDYSTSPSLHVSSGRLIYYPQFAYHIHGCQWYIDYTIPSDYELNTVDELWDKFKIRRYANSMGGLGSTNGSHVGYEQVIIRYPANGYEIHKFDMPGQGDALTDLCNPSGSCIYNRPTHGGYPYSALSYSLFPFPNNPNLDWARGQLLETHIYSETDELRTSTFHEYDIVDDINIPLLTVKQLCWDGGSIRDLRYGQSYLTSGWKRMTKTTTRTYDLDNSGDYLETITDYQYNNADHKYVNIETTTLNNGRILTHEYYYPADYTHSSNVNHPALNLMKGTLHFHSPVIEKITLIDDGSGPQVAYAGFNKYRIDQANRVVIDEQYSTDIAAPTIAFSKSVYTGDPDMLHHQRRITYDTYDDRMNLLSYTYEHDRPDAYLWRDDVSYPTALVTNTNGQSYAFTSFEEGATGNWTFDDTKVQPETSTDMAKTGQAYYLLKEATITSQSLQPGYYLMTYWRRSSTSPEMLSLGDVANTIKRTTENPALDDGWELVEYIIEIQVGSPVSLTSSSHTHIDEIRLYPLTGTMITFCYDEHDQIIDIMDEKNHKVSYDYDQFLRLFATRNFEDHVIEKITYSFR